MDEKTTGSPQLGIRFENVSKTYASGALTREVLVDVSTGIPRGEFAVIRGPSGSGKTTLLNLAAGIDEPSRGEIWIGKRALGSMTRREKAQFRREHIGFVFQFFNLISTLSVMENILLPVELDHRAGPDAREQARSLLMQVGLEGRERDFPDRLSGGEQQRVALARALILQPRLILADEPTGNLDQSRGDEVLDLLQMLQDRQGSTLLMVTHSHRLAQRADRVYTIQGGHLVAEAG